jgi:hypothetical protein
MAPTQCPNSNYSACSKFYHYSSKSKAIYRGCAVKKLDDRCYFENPTSDTQTCLYWCDDADGCNSGSRLKISYLIYIKLLVIILILDTGFLYLRKKLQS